MKGYRQGKTCRSCQTPPSGAFKRRTGISNLATVCLPQSWIGLESVFPVDCPLRILDWKAFSQWTVPCVSWIGLESVFSGGLAPAYFGLDWKAFSWWTVPCVSWIGLESVFPVDCPLRILDWIGKRFPGGLSPAYLGLDWKAFSRWTVPCVSWIGLESVFPVDCPLRILDWKAFSRWTVPCVSWIGLESVFSGGLAPAYLGLDWKAFSRWTVPCVSWIGLESVFPVDCPLRILHYGPMVSTHTTLTLHPRHDGKESSITLYYTFYLKRLS